MKQLRKIVTQLHTRTKRDYLGRMQDEKTLCMQKAKEYDLDYWDGDRRFGYGGYHYDGRWQIVAEKLVEFYNLKDMAKILDVGCGKGYLLYELKKLLPQAEIHGFDISPYAIENAHPEIKSSIFVHRAQETYPFVDNTFDLVYSINTLHNLEIFDLKKALQEMERVGAEKYLCVESYRNENELFNLQCWALTCEAFHTPVAWQWLFHEFGYTGDYEFIFFE